MTLTKIYTGMEHGPETIDANFDELKAGQQIVSYTIGTADNTLAADKITAINGTLKRVGNNVYLSLHVNVSDYGSGALDLMYVPAGYQIDNNSASQYPLAMEQNATTPMPRAFIYAAPKGPVISAQATKGNLYISGSWTTSDDFPD